MLPAPISDPPWPSQPHGPGPGRFWLSHLAALVLVVGGPGPRLALMPSNMGWRYHNVGSWWFALNDAPHSPLWAVIVSSGLSWYPSPHCPGSSDSRALQPNYIKAHLLYPNIFPDSGVPAYPAFDTAIAPTIQYSHVAYRPTASNTYKNRENCALPILCCAYALR